MPTSAGPIVGTIAIDPLAVGAGARWPARTDDSTLAALLASFAHCESLDCESLDDEHAEEVECLVTSTRWSRSTHALEESQAIKADLARLMVELDSEYDALVRPL